MNAFEVDGAELSGASSTIGEAIAPAEGIGLDSVNGVDFGHDGVSGELAAFTSTWQAMIGVLHRQASSASEELLSVRDAYAGADEAIGRSFQAGER